MAPSLPTLYPLVFTLIHLVLASGVTIHALSFKREPRAAVAWIGLAWLSPVLGSIVYMLLGINRVRTRAQSLRGTAPDTRRLALPGTTLGLNSGLGAIEISGTRITGRYVEDGNRIDLYENGDSAYPVMLEAIENSIHSVGLASYLFRADEAGNRFIEALVRAQQRGVEVRVLIDGVGSGYFRCHAYRELRSRNVNCVRFLHSVTPWRMPFINLRNHRKLLIIDGRVAFTGGLNIGAENLVATHGNEAVLDKHFRIEGAVVAQIREVFASDWLFSTGETLAGERWIPKLKSCGTTRARTVTSGPDQDLEKTELLIMEAVNCARRSVRIMTPYFLPDERLMTALSLAALRGADVDIVLPEKSNQPWVDWANRAHIGPLLDSGCRLWTHPAPFDHSKLLVVDGLWCLIGSANWDTRSFTLNFEMNVELYDPTLALQLEDLILKNTINELNTSLLSKRTLSVRLRDSATRLFAPYL